MMNKLFNQSQMTCKLSIINYLQSVVNSVMQCNMVMKHLKAKAIWVSCILKFTKISFLNSTTFSQSLLGDVGFSNYSKSRWVP